MCAKIAIFQLDSCDSDFLKDNLDHLPNLRRMVGPGGIRPLQTDEFAGSTNTCFNTGQRSEDHGVYFQLQWDPRSMRLRSLDPEWIGDLTPFWRRGRLAGLRGIVLDPSFTLVDPASRHLEILGWSAHSSLVPFQCTEPAEARRIRGRFGVNPIGNEVQLDRGPEARGRERDAMIRSARARGELLTDLVRRREWDFLYAVFGETHRAGHVLWPSKGVTPPGALLEVFKAVDEALGRVVAALPEGTEVVLFATQGMGHQAAQGHLCRPLLDAALAAMGYEARRFRARPNAVAWLRDAVPARLQWEIRNHIPLRLRDRVVARQYAGGLVPGETAAFPLQSDNNGYWRFLVRGREAAGTLEPAEAERLREGFGQILGEFRTPEGEPLVSRVLFPTLSDGARSQLLPDVVAVWNPEIRQVARAHHPVAGTVQARPDAARTGNHRFRAFFSHAGRAPDGVARPEHISDLARYIEALAV